MKYYGKEKCRILKEIRAEIAKANNIEWVVSECKHQGNCKGTCPKCEQEVRQLEAALARREALGKTVAVVGISAAISLAVTGCDSPFQPLGGKPLGGEDMPAQTEEVYTAVLDGEMEPPQTDIETEYIEMMGDIYIPPETETETEGETDTDDFLMDMGEMPEDPQ